MSDDPQYDVLVIGGGIHGVGVAQAAAAAGYSVLVLESKSLAHGSSSRSSKLIHGGLRYLETFELALVRESLHERELLLKLAPDLVRRQPFVIPVYPYTSRRPMTLRAGLSLYWLLAGMGRRTGFERVSRREWTQLDGLATRDLQYVFRYWDAQTDDRQLTRAVMRSAESLGAELQCPAEFSAAKIGADRCVVEYQQFQQTKTVAARVLVNAAGPWATQVAARITPRPPTVNVELVQGTHIELPGEVRHGCYYLEAPQDSRAVFVMPWKGHSLVGTTELKHTGDPDKTAPTQAEVDYLLAVFRHYFPGRSADVIDQWAGLRVLPAGRGAANRRSRETQLPVNDARRPRVISIFGGKLTGYRATAEKIMLRMRRSLGQRKPIADTKQLKLVAPLSDLEPEA